MDIKEIPIRPTADLLSEYVFGKVTDTAVGGAIAHELQDRGINANDVMTEVRELIAMLAGRVDDDDDDELDYCGGLEPGSWCEDKEEDHE
jgi:hypothetical protein